MKRGDHCDGDEGEAETKDGEKGQGREQEDLGADLKVKGRRKGGDRLKKGTWIRGEPGNFRFSNQASGSGEGREKRGGMEGN